MHVRVHTHHTQKPHLAKVPNSGDSGHCLLIHVSRLLKVARSDVVVSKGDPELANHVSEPLQASANDGIHLQGRDLEMGSGEWQHLV